MAKLFSLVRRAFGIMATDAGIDYVYVAPNIIQYRFVF